MIRLDHKCTYVEYQKEGYNGKIEGGRRMVGIKMGKQQ